MPYLSPAFEVLIRCFHICTIPPTQRALVPFFKQPTFRNFDMCHSSLSRRPPLCNINPFRNPAFERYPFGKDVPPLVRMGSRPNKQPSTLGKNASTDSNQYSEFLGIPGIPPHKPVGFSPKSRFEGDHHPSVTQETSKGCGTDVRKNREVAR